MIVNAIDPQELSLDERTRLLDSAFVEFSMGAEGKTVSVELRYRPRGQRAGPLRRAPQDVCLLPPGPQVER